eukprot:TRINITY_DN1550_c0_g1_i1.p1 TRINITY_DN1550_c0_g1~~TRINITY_DN1550_c0_g1_i1.p1  ORF type:complete len:251 (-),score=34.67 TRINITY_DN1550_c0_g1_i1:267-1019(-)
MSEAVSTTTALDKTRLHVALLALYLGKAETRDKLCRAIQYGSKFVSQGKPGTAQNVDKSTSLARKVFRLLKSVNEIQALLTPASKTTPLPLVLLGRIKSCLIATFLGLDQIVWLGRSGIYKNKERTDQISKISLYCWLAGTFCTSIIEASEISRLASASSRIEKERRRSGSNGSLNSKQKEELVANAKKARERSLNLVKSGLDVFVAAGLLQLAPKSLDARVTGLLGFITSLISCYQLYPPVSAVKGKGD